MNDKLTKAEKTIVNSIRRYPTIYPNKDKVLNHMLLGNGTGYEWVSGELKNYFPLKQQPFKVAYKTACNLLISTTFFTYSGYYSKTPLWNIPDNITPDWLEECRNFIYKILKTKTSYYAIMVKGNFLMHYGDGFYNHPDKMIFNMYKNAIEEFKELKIRAKELAKEKGWHWMYRRRTKKQIEKMNNIVKEILDEMDELDK